MKKSSAHKAKAATGSPPHKVRKAKAAVTQKPVKRASKTAPKKAAIIGATPQKLGEDAMSRLLEAVKNSPSFKSAADDDPAFLAHPLTRGVRLQLDYYKPEVIMREHRIGGGVVVFGSARTPSPEQAQERLKRAEKALTQAMAKTKVRNAEPSDKAALRAAVQVAQRDVSTSRYYAMARDFGRMVSLDGAKRKGARLVIITGGGPGIMEAANRGAHDVHAPSIGFNISLPHEQWPNPYITPELCFNFHYFAIRKLHFVMRARALVAFPGGFGTLDELFEILTLVQTRKTRQRPVVLVGKAFWDSVFKLDALIAEGMIDANDRHLFRFAESAREAWDIILDWYVKHGQPLIEGAEAKPVVG
jgi:uncharacterized protein (TIGR00730 family)